MNHHKPATMMTNLYKQRLEHVLVPSRTQMSTTRRRSNLVCMLYPVSFSNKTNRLIDLMDVFNDTQLRDNYSSYKQSLYVN